MSKIVDTAKYETRKLADLKNWEDNPRTITEEEFARLKAQITQLGVYKPLVINQQNIVLGGNMRLRALKELGVEEVMCAIVLTDNRAQMIEYSLSDNDQAGVTDVQKVQELTTLEPVKSELYAIHSTPMKLVSSLKADAGPEAEKKPKDECRHCPVHCEGE